MCLNAPELADVMSFPRRLSTKGLDKFIVIDYNMYEDNGKMIFAK